MTPELTMNGDVSIRSIAASPFRQDSEQRNVINANLSKSAQSGPHHSDTIRSSRTVTVAGSLNPLNRGLTIPTTLKAKGRNRCQLSQSAQSRPHHSDNVFGHGNVVPG